MREDFHLAIEILRGVYGSDAQITGAIGVALAGAMVFWLAICAFWLLEPLA